MSKLSWPCLKKGDAVDLILPASICLQEELDEAVSFVQSLGFVPLLPKDFRKETYLFSQSDQIRFQHLKNSLFSKKSKAVWCVRGGYGSQRLISGLLKLKKPNLCKPLLGLSDISVIHQFLNQKWNWPSLHSIVLSRVGGGRAKPAELTEIEAVLKGEVAMLDFTNLTPLNEAAQKKKKIISFVRGGNLAVVHSTLGSPWSPQFKDAIVFLEDINERGYKVDRYLNSLQNAQVFKSAKAVVFGDFTGGLEPDGNQRWMEALEHFAKEVKIPVLKGILSGHGELQRCVPFNTKTELFLGESPYLTSQTGGTKK